MEYLRNFTFRGLVLCGSALVWRSWSRW